LILQENKIDLVGLASFCDKIIEYRVKIQDIDLTGNPIILHESSLSIPLMEEKVRLCKSINKAVEERLLSHLKLDPQALSSDEEAEYF
jgi:hypothetical protein